YSVQLITNGALLTSDFGTIQNLGGGHYIIDNIPNGQNILVFANTSFGICEYVQPVTAPNCNCTLQTEDLVDTLTLCPGDTFRLIPFVTGAAGFPHTYWIDQNQDTVEWFSFKVDRAGTFTWVVIDSLGCETRDTFTSVFVGPTGIDIETISPPCPEDVTGQLVIHDVLSGRPPYSIQLDNDPPISAGSFPVIIPDVSIGTHQVMVTDLTGCTLDIPVLLQPNIFGSFDLGPDVTIPKGDSAHIQPQAFNLNPANVIWNFPGLSSSLNSFWIRPDSTFTLHATVTDTAGCQYDDELTITVFEKPKFYIPTVFSPNNDQINDQAIVNTNLPPDHLISFEIFDRWGNLLYGQYENPPFAWDGHTKGDPAMTGVYVYKLVWKDEFNQRQLTVGDITLIR
ncbi:MAG TPA: gliding motility-associated C-terminal domain-containing protein, partial [Saprospiraceae bacterium]|nr:gliding motility-associated C-terminal domain-containing protein [Saprospiraceae bacterium]